MTTKYKVAYGTLDSGNEYHTVVLDDGNYTPLCFCVEKVDAQFICDSLNALNDLASVLFCGVRFTK